VTSMLIINCKNYNEIAGEKINKLASIAEKIAKKHKIQIALAPPHHQLASIKKSNCLYLHSILMMPKWAVLLGT